MQAMFAVMTMKDLEKRAVEGFPIFEEQAKRLIDLIKDAEKTLDGSQHSHDDHFGLVLLVFYRKQIEHLQSILKLAPSRDTNLIARSMLEGASQIYWIAQKDPAELQDTALLFHHLLILLV